MEIRAVDFFAYTVEDMARSLEFYSEMFGIDPEFVVDHEGAPMWAELDVHGVTIALNASGQGSPGGAVAFAVDDVEAAVEEMKGKGAEVVFGPFESPVCWVAAVQDPDGNSIFLHHRHDGTCG